MENSISCIIIDDEHLGQELIEKYVKRIPSLNLLAKCENAIEALERVSTLRPNLIFLDVNMPEMTGIEFIKTFSTYKPIIVLTTAYPEYAIDGYDLDVLDFILKPITFDRFVKAINKVREKMAYGNFSTQSQIPEIQVSDPEKPTSTEAQLKNREYAAYKFFIFTQASGLLMLLAILGLYFIHGGNTGVYTFNYFELLGTVLSADTAFWLMMGFMIAFVVKLPIVPFHSWLPDAHSEAPTAGSLILAGLLLKTGAYGILRFVLPLFPEASLDLAPWAMSFGVIGIIYGAVLAYAQTDLKRLVAYTSVSHMGFVILGIFAFNELALQGVVMQLVTHAISTGALFILAGMLKERLHTRDIDQMGGLWLQMPGMGAIALLLIMASLGLPGLGNFIAEFLILLGAFKVNVWLTVLAATGLIFSAVYSLRIVQKVFFGTPEKVGPVPDFSWREMVIMAALTLSITWLGVYPQPVINTVRPMINRLEQVFPDRNRKHSPVLQVKPSIKDKYQVQKHTADDDT
jgi:NADH-quinone oxidoreductase subunit M